MTHPEALQAYKEKYAKFPDLVQRIVSQIQDGISTCHLTVFVVWDETKEGGKFWRRIYDLEETSSLTRESIDSAYKEFGIEPLTPEIDMNAFVENGYYWPLFSHLSEVHGLTLIDTEMDQIINIVKGMETVKTSE